MPKNRMMHPEEVMAQTIVVNRAAFKLLGAVDRLAAGLVMAERERTRLADRLKVQAGVSGLVGCNDPLYKQYEDANARVEAHLDEYNKLTDQLVDVYRDGLPG